jgi:hypothetical protein
MHQPAGLYGRTFEQIVERSKPRPPRDLSKLLDLAQEVAGVGSGLEGPYTLGLKLSLT